MFLSSVYYYRNVWIDFYTLVSQIRISSLYWGTKIAICVSLCKDKRVCHNFFPICFVSFCGTVILSSIFHCSVSEGRSLHFNAMHEISLPTKNVGIEMTFFFLSYLFRCSISEEISPESTTKKGRFTFGELASSVLSTFEMTFSFCHFDSDALYRKKDLKNSIACRKLHYCFLNLCWNIKSFVKIP